MAKHSINLLQADLLPAKALWTLNRVAGLWLLTLLLMLGLIVVAQMQLSSVEAELESVKLLNNNQKLQLESYC